MLETKSISLLGDKANNIFILNPLNYALMEINLKFIPDTLVYLQDWQFIFEHVNVIGSEEAKPIALPVTF